MDWRDVTNWVMYGGSFLGTQKQLPGKILNKIAQQLRKFNIHGLLLIGGFEVRFISHFFEGFIQIGMEILIFDILI